MNALQLLSEQEMKDLVREGTLAIGKELTEVRDVSEPILGQLPNQLRLYILFTDDTFAIVELSLAETNIHALLEQSDPGEPLPTLH